MLIFCFFAMFSITAYQMWDLNIIWISFSTSKTGILNTTTSRSMGMQECPLQSNLKWILMFMCVLTGWSLRCICLNQLKCPMAGHWLDRVHQTEWAYRRAKSRGSGYVPTSRCQDSEKARKQPHNHTEIPSETDHWMLPDSLQMFLVASSCASKFENGLLQWLVLK